MLYNIRFNITAWLHHVRWSITDTDLRLWARKSPWAKVTDTVLRLLWLAIEAVDPSEEDYTDYE